MRKAELEITNACVTKFFIDQNGYGGGDASHGGYVEIAIQNVSSTNMHFSIDGGAELPCESIQLTFKGDAERQNLIQGLEFMLRELKVLEEAKQDSVV